MKKLMMMLILGITVFTAGGGLTNIDSTRSAKAIVTTYAANKTSNDAVTQEAIQIISDILEKIFNVIGLISMGVGLLMCAYGFFQLILSFTDNGGESRKQAAIFLTVGIILVILKFLLASMDLTGLISRVYGGSTNNNNVETEESVDPIQ